MKVQLQASCARRTALQVPRGSAIQPAGSDRCLSACTTQVVILVTSILSTSIVLDSLPLMRLKRSTLIVDVLSVKVGRGQAAVRGRQLVQLGLPLQLHTLGQLTLPCLLHPHQYLRSCCSHHATPPGHAITGVPQAVAAAKAATRVGHPVHPPHVWSQLWLWLLEGPQLPV